MRNSEQHNTITLEDEDFPEKYDFQYNFINIPWDDRTRKSKVFSILLLVSILVAIAACLLNFIVMLYQSPQLGGQIGRSGDLPKINCRLSKASDFRFVARIKPIDSHEVLCVGAVVGENQVLANGACVKNRQIRVFVGSIADPRCKKGFSIHTTTILPHAGVISKTLVLLITNKSMLPCAKTVQIGADTMDINSIARVIGRSINTALDGLLSRQPVRMIGQREKCVCQGLRGEQQTNLFCVKLLTTCPLSAGDLLLQGGMLYGIASTSVHPHHQLSQACFADLSVIVADVRDFSFGADY